MSRKLTALLAAIVIAATLSAPAMAEHGRRTIHVAVSYADLDLTRDEGVKTLSSRIKRAAKIACGRSHGSASLTIRRAIDACRADAVSAAVASIDAPLLRALHDREAPTRVALR